MKKTLLLVISILLLSCGSSSQVATEDNPVLETLKNADKQASAATVKQSKPNILVGKQERNALEQEPFGSWFNSNYENYTVDKETLNKISPYLKDVKIKVFMGTWCGDSKRETPTFYKILDKAEFDYQNLELITVTRAKDTPEGYEKDLNILRVPTFIFYKEGKEIGRYVEYARESLEKDMLAIVTGQAYKHSYED